MLGKHSGRHAFAERVRDLGYDPQDVDFEKVFTQFKALADKKKTVYNEDIEALVTDQLLRGDREHFKLENLSVTSGTFATPTATVEMRVGEEIVKSASMGDGPVDAVFKAIASLTDTKARVLRYQVNAITSGMDAQGEVAVTLEEDGLRVIGQGAHTDIIVASAHAYIHALNKLAQRRTAGERSLRGI